MHAPLEHLLFHRLRQLHDLNRAALVVPAPDETFFFERGNMLVHGCKRRQLQSLADLLEARCVAVFRLERNQKIEDFLLPFGEGHGSPPGCNVLVSTLGENKANVKLSLETVVGDNTSGMALCNNKPICFHITLRVVAPVL